MARTVADRLADAGFTTAAPPTGAAGTHVLVTAFAAVEPSPAIYEETRRVIAAMAPGSWWLDMTYYPPDRVGDDLWVPARNLARVRRIPVPVIDMRGVLVASPPTVLDLRGREVCDAVLAIADLVLPTQRPEYPVASLDLALAEPRLPFQLRPRTTGRASEQAAPPCAHRRTGLRLV
ncbi:hypothetical protein [Kitasatospora aureofaciens]|uniref:hypothetical protein n=1 Tax=Kitasatospora aureofaciens TaxID=1894 RepID=UPI0005267686|nr:hypothetical protein [Kitasatospora aureofaciens]